MVVHTDTTKILNKVTVPLLRIENGASKIFYFTIVLCAQFLNDNL